MDAKDKRSAELEGLAKKLLQRIAVLEKNSKSSSKNPSSDIVKPQKPKLKDENGNIAKQKIGAQKGHKQNLRKPITPDLVDSIVKLDLTNCPDCGHKLSLQKNEPKITQQIELVEKPVVVTEYQQLRYWFDHFQCYHLAPLPEKIVKSGLFCPKLTTLTAYLKGRCHTSYRTIKDFMYDVLGEDFLGTISSDFYSAYLKYRKETETLFQFCWSHLIREIKFLTTLSDTKTYGNLQLHRSRLRPRMVSLHVAALSCC
ncbi:MAG: DUF6444 domain-containing protein [Thermoguttaceae bacterium]